LVVTFIRAVSSVAFSCTQGEAEKPEPVAQGGEGRKSTDSGGLPAFNPAFALNSHVAVEIADEASLDRKTADEWLRLKSAVFAEASKEQWKGKPPGVNLDGLRWWQEQRFRTHAAWGLFCRTFPL